MGGHHEPRGRFHINPVESSARGITSVCFSGPVVRCRDSVADGVFKIAVGSVPVEHLRPRRCTNRAHAPLDHTVLAVLVWRAVFMLDAFDSAVMFPLARHVHSFGVGSDIGDFPRSLIILPKSLPPREISKVFVFCLEEVHPCVSAVIADVQLEDLSGLGVSDIHVDPMDHASGTQHLRGRERALLCLGDGTLRTRRIVFRGGQIQQRSAVGEVWMGHSPAEFQQLLGEP